MTPPPPPSPWHGTGHQRTIPGLSPVRQSRLVKRTLPPTSTPYMDRSGTRRVAGIVPPVPGTTRHGSPGFERHEREYDTRVYENTSSSYGPESVPAKRTDVMSHGSPRDRRNNAAKWTILIRETPRPKYRNEIPSLRRTRSRFLRYARTIEIRYFLRGIRHIAYLYWKCEMS